MPETLADGAEARAGSHLGTLPARAGDRQEADSRVSVHRVRLDIVRGYGRRQGSTGDGYSIDQNSGEYETVSNATIIRRNMSYVFDNFRNNEDNVLLHGIDIEFIDGAWCPVVPHGNALTALAVARPDCFEFRWIALTKKWLPIYE